MGMRCVLTATTVLAARTFLADRDEMAQQHASKSGPKSLRLEKSWHALHFVLTGAAGEGNDPLGFLLAGGETIEDQDTEDDMPARILMPEYVHQLDGALAKITKAEFDRRFDTGRLAGEDIYPDIWGESRADLLNEYQFYFESLKRFVHSAAQHGEAIVVMIG